MQTQHVKKSAWRIMDPVKWQIRFAMLLSVISSLCALVALCMLALALKTLQQTQQWPVEQIGAAVICVVFAYLGRVQALSQSHYAAFKLENLLRTQLSQHLGVVSMGFVQQFGASKISKVIQEDVKELHVFVADSTPLYARAYVAPVLTLIGLLLLDLRLALAIVGLIAIGMVILAIAMRGHNDLSKHYMETREEVSATIVEYVQAMPVVRTFETGTSSFRRYSSALDKYRNIVVSWYQSVSFSSRFSIGLLHAMPTMVVLVWVGSFLVWQQSLSMFTWVAVLLIGTGMVEAVTPLITLIHLVEKAKISVSRIEQLLAVPVLPIVNQPLEPCNHSVRFHQVAFAYDKTQGNVLNKIDFVVPEGSVTALVGPSGSGKSTIAQLIPRFWDVTEGSVKIGEVDVRAMTHECLMAQVAFVFQDTFLFAQSIADNIRLGCPNASIDEVIAAAKVAQADEFIRQLPQGYETCPGERGVFLSGGQKQRITIARAVLQNRPILVLDEATAFSDPENEAAIIAALSQLMQGKTVILVAHRLNTIQNVDQILVLEHGELVEQGQHQQLLEQNGVYARLWQKHQQAQSWRYQAQSAPEQAEVNVRQGELV